MSEQWILRDIPIAQLYPFRKRVISQGVEGCMRASIVRCGLLEPLIVFPEDDVRYCILDGHVRYAALKGLDYKTARCRFRMSVPEARKTKKTKKKNQEDEIS